jgi:hypothetical protein
MRRSSWWILGTATVGLSLIAVSCGAQDAIAPAAEHDPAQVQCKGFDELMPNFENAINTGQTEGLREVFQDHLLVSSRPDVPPPANDVLRALFGILAGYAKLPHEAGAPEGEYCALTPPPITQSHPLCDLRRTMDLMVHQQAGIDTIRLLDPLIGGAVDYFIGKAPSATTPHYELAGVISSMCQPSVACQMSDTLDFLAGFTDFAQTDAGKAMIPHVVALVNNPALEPYLSDDAQTYGGEAGMVAVVKLLTQTVEGMQSPDDLDSLPIDSMPADLQPDLRNLVADMKLMMDPNLQPNILAPMKKVMNCLSVEDTNSELVRMIFRLGLEQHLPAFGLHNLINLVNTLLSVDQRGTLLHLVNTLVVSLRQDDQAMNSAAKVCEELFSNTVAPGDTQSNAQLAMPVVSTLFDQGVLEEGVCAADTLLYGCAGGTQPACTPPAP